MVWLLLNHQLESSFEQNQKLLIHNTYFETNWRRTMRNRMRMFLIALTLFTLPYTAFGSFEWFSHIRFGQPSAAHDDAQSSAVCESWSTMVGCKCKNKVGGTYQNEDCDGSYVSGNRCIAQNAWDGQGVTAIAQCTRVPAGSQLEYVSTPDWGKDPTVTCSPGFKMLSCSCLSHWKDCKHSFALSPSQGYCKQYSHGSLAKAYAVCYKAP